MIDEKKKNIIQNIKKKKSLFNIKYFKNKKFVILTSLRIYNILSATKDVIIFLKNFSKFIEESNSFIT
jgi:hypothetical protein